MREIYINPQSTGTAIQGIRKVFTEFVNNYRICKVFTEFVKTKVFRGIYRICKVFTDIRKVL